MEKYSALIQSYAQCEERENIHGLFAKNTTTMQFYAAIPIAICQLLSVVLSASIKWRVCGRNRCMSKEVMVRQQRK